MSGILRLRREIASFLATYIGAAAEVLVDETNWRLLLQDGVTPGGVPLARLADVNLAAVNAVNNALAPNGVRVYTTSGDISVATAALYQQLLGVTPATLTTFQQVAAQFSNDESGVAALTTVVGTKAPLARQIATPAGGGILGGGDLTADRSLTFDTTFGDARYLKPARQIATPAGGGILGGGDLTADRSLTFDTTFGDTRYLTLAGAQTITGAKTFSASPQLPSPAQTDNSAYAAPTSWVQGLLSAFLAKLNTWTAAQTFVSAILQGGSINATPIGQTTPAAGTFSTLRVPNDLNSTFGSAVTAGVVGIELGSFTTAGLAYIDFHSSGAGNDYDARLIATSGSATNGQGTLTVSAGSFASSAPFSANAGIATLSANLDASFGSTRGSLLYRGASGWSLMAPGTSGNVLTSNGAGADPSYQAPGVQAGALRYDVAQSLTTAQITQVLANLAQSQSLAASGYIKLAGGLILQWASQSNVYGTWTFPVAFPTACVAAGATPISSNTAVVIAAFLAAAPSKTSASFIANYTANGGAISSFLSTGLVWALGY